MGVVKPIIRRTSKARLYQQFKKITRDYQQRCPKILVGGETVAERMLCKFIITYRSTELGQSRPSNTGRHVQNCLKTLINTGYDINQRNRSGRTIIEMFDRRLKLRKRILGSIKPAPSTSWLTMGPCRAKEEEDMWIGIRRFLFIASTFAAASAQLSSDCYKNQAVVWTVIGSVPYVDWYLTILGI